MSKFMMADIGYDDGLTTADKSIPDLDERQQYYNDQVVADGDGNIVIVNKKLIFGTLGLLVGLMVVLHYTK